MAERVVRNVENDYLMCSICLDRYNDPRLLPCGHSFCKQCLTDHIRETVTDRGASYFTCPNDRTQVPRPSRRLAPKDWAAAFPVDTLLSGMLSAVMLHANDVDGAVCRKHKGRLKEFYCMECSKAVCGHCIVTSHKSRKCDCVSIEEAVNKCRPKFEMLRQKMQLQIHTARKIYRRENTQDNSLEMSRMRAMTELKDLENKLVVFTQTAFQQIEVFKKTIGETERSDVSENQPINAILQNMTETIDRVDVISTHGSGIEILDSISKIDRQTKVYDDVLSAFSANANYIKINFASNPEMERVFENAGAALGAVYVTNQTKQTHQNSSTSDVATTIHRPMHTSRNEK